MYDVNNSISMHIFTSQILSHPRQEDLQPRLIPAQNSGEGSCTQRSDTLAHVLIRDGAEKLVLLAFRPRVDGDVKSCFGDVDEANVFHVLAPILAVFEVTPDSRHGFDHEIVPSVSVSTSEQWDIGGPERQQRTYSSSAVPFKVLSSLNMGKHGS